MFTSDCFLMGQAWNYEWFGFGIWILILMFWNYYEKCLMFLDGCILDTCFRGLNWWLDPRSRPLTVYCGLGTFVFITFVIVDWDTAEKEWKLLCIEMLFVLRNCKFIDKMFVLNILWFQSIIFLYLIQLIRSCYLLS